MPAKDFDVGNLVWAKMKGFPSWPGKIIDPPADAKSPSQRKSQHCVYFFGSDNHAWVLDENIVPHDDSLVQSASKRKDYAYQNAIETIVNMSRNAKKEKTVREKEQIADIESSQDKTPKAAAPQILKEKEQIADKKSSQNKTPQTVAPKILKEKEQIADKELSQSKTSSQIKTPNQTKSRKQSKTPSQDEAPNQSNTPNSVNSVPKKGVSELKHVSIKKSNVPIQRKTARKRPSIDTETVKKRPSIATGGAECPVSYPKSELVENDCADLLASVPLNTGYSHSDALLAHDSSYQSSGILSRPEFIEQPPTPVHDVSDVSESLNKKEVTPSDKKIGFLGLGNMGQDIVKNLLNSGHHVTVWNRTASKMDILVEAGASRGQTPADVVKASDITFCCVSDSDAVKCLVFGNCGVLTGFDSCPGSNKGYVEMTSIDPETSQAVAVEITLKGGRYLEAPIAGTKQQAIEGTLFILAAGDRALFAECETCFRAIGEKVHYINSDVGIGAKANLVRSMLRNSLSALMAETMALVKDCKLSQGVFLEIFKTGPFNCELMLKKGHAILEHNSLPDPPLKYLKKDLDLVTKLGESVDQPLLIAAAATGAYNRRAKQLHHYADHDVSAAHQGTRY